MAAAGTDLFAWLDSLWNKQALAGTPPIFVLHRFLASDPELAKAARVLRQEVREPELIVATWQALLPKGRGAPRLSYVGIKRPPAEEALITRMKMVLHERRAIVEEMVTLITEMGRANELYAFYGIAPPGTKA